MFRQASATLVAWMLISALPNAARASDRADRELAPSAAQLCTAEQGQSYIEEGRYRAAIREFTCLIEAEPTGIEGYRGRIEAELLLGLYSDAVHDYARVAAYVEPVHPDAAAIIYAAYDVRLALDGEDTAALTGASFAHWWFFDYPHAIQLLDDLLTVEPDDLYGTLFRGSSQLLLGTSPAAGDADIAQALALAPDSPDVHYVVADACLYGRADYACAFEHAAIALDGGRDTPRVHAILAASYLAFGNLPASGEHTKRHIELVTTELVAAPTLPVRSSLSLALVPGRTYVIPLPAVAGQVLSITTRSSELFDSIVALFAPDGTPILGSDDARNYFAEFDWPVPVSGTYWLWATSFEGVGTGSMVVARR